MTLGGRRFLGLMMGDHSLAVADVRVGGKGHEVRQTLAFPFPEGLSLEQPAALGKALRASLRAQRFASGTVVIGLPARWVLVKEKTTPPADAAALAGLLRLEAERDFATPPEELTLDYLEIAADEKERRVLLLAASRAKVEQSLALADAAGLRVKAVMPALLALADADFWA